jgi:hypothetical protein
MEYDGAVSHFMSNPLIPAVRTVQAIRYVTPLREGGSLPAIVEADDDGTYVLKFRGAGQGAKALIAELVAGEVGRTLGLRVPELVFMQLDPELARTERDPEIQELIRASAGLNLALDYLPGALGFEDLDVKAVDAKLASEVVWFDAYVTNVDRTIRNPNLLTWKKQLWLIDHGAALFFHHAWDGYQARSRSPFAPIREHILLRRASALDEADMALRARLVPACLGAIVALIPDAWLGDEPAFAGAAEHRAAYAGYLSARLEASRIFVEEAQHARARLL